MINVGNTRKPTKSKPKKLIVDSFKGFTNTLVSSTRLRKDEAAESDNLMQTEDGVWSTRWGTKDYGTVGAWSGNDIDGVAQFVDADGDIHLCVVANGVFYRSTDDGANWYSISGATFTAGHKCFFTQYGAYDNVSETVIPYLYVVNGIDPIIRYDGTSLDEYAEISPPTSVTPTKTGLTGTTYTYYYVVEAYTSGGSTGPSTEASVTVGTQRNQWDSSSNYVTVTWTAATDAAGYLIFVGTQSGDWYFIADVQGQATASFKDIGSDLYPQVQDWEPGIENTTGGPTLKSICVSGNRLFGVDTSGQVRWTGSGGVERGSWGLWVGGGSLGVDRGGAATLTTIVDYQNKPHAFASYPHGGGRIYSIDEGELTVAGETLPVFTPNKLLDDTGTSAVGSVIPVENDVFYWDSGVRVLGNEPGVLAVLRTNELTQRIRPTVNAVDSTATPNIDAVYYDGKILFSVPYGSSDNNRIIVYDRERLGWVPNWSVGVKQFVVYTDNEDERRLLGCTGDKLIEFSSNYLGDSSVAFQQQYVGPKLAAGDDDFTEFNKYKYLYVRLRAARGTINISVSGTAKSAPFSSLANRSVTPAGSNTGLSWELLSTVQLSDSTGIPSTFQSESIIVRVPIKKRVRNIQVTVSSSTIGSTWTLVGYILTSKPIKTSDPADWKA